jgi:hypothetical protein
MSGINVAVFIINKRRRINLFLKIGFVVEAFVGALLYINFYDYISTY